MDFRKWWKSRVRAIGREIYIRFFPNPGFRVVFRGSEIRWTMSDGWKAGRIIKGK